MLRQFHDGCCNRCGQYAPLRRAAFHRHIGMLVLMQHKRVDALLCRRCIDRICLEYTLITLVAGWWGMLSVVITPFILIYNILGYLGALSLKRRSESESLMPGTAPGAMAAASIAVPPADNEWDLDLSAPELPAGTRFGNYILASRTPTALAVQRRSALSLGFGLTACGCILAGAVDIVIEIVGYDGPAGLIFLLPIGIVLGVIWLFLQPGSVQVDAQTRDITITSGQSKGHWSDKDYYAVYIDAATPQNSEPMLEIIVAERYTTTPWGGTRIARCPVSDPACTELIGLAATIAGMLRLPVRCTEDARQVALPARLQSLLTPQGGALASAATN